MRLLIDVLVWVYAISAVSSNCVKFKHIPRSDTSYINVTIWNGTDAGVSMIDRGETQVFSTPLFTRLVLQHNLNNDTVDFTYDDIFQLNDPEVCTPITPPAATPGVRGNCSEGGCCKITLFASFVYDGERTYAKLRARVNLRQPFGLPRIYVCQKDFAGNASHAGFTIETRLDKRWKRAKVEWGITCQDEEDECIRFRENWEATLARIDIFNQGQPCRDGALCSGTPAYSQGINEFAFLNETENDVMNAADIPDEVEDEFNLQSSGAREFDLIPDSFDWRNASDGLNYLTPVKHQGSRCGSCWAFAATCVLESITAIKFGHGYLQDLSEQNMLDCTYNRDGCRNGFYKKAWWYIGSNRGGKLKGQNLDSGYPIQYTTSSRHSSACDFNNKCSKIGVGSVSRIKKVTRNDPVAMMEKVANVGPVAAVVNANNNWYSYTSGIMPASECSNRVNHAVVVVGYGEEHSVKYWVVRNSWGTRWGEGGYIRLQRTDSNGPGTCGILKFAMIPRVSANDDCPMVPLTCVTEGGTCQSGGTGCTVEAPLSTTLTCEPGRECCAPVITTTPQVPNTTTPATCVTVGGTCQSAGGQGTCQCAGGQECCAPGCPGDFEMLEGECYLFRLSAEAVSYDDAAQACSSENSYLVRLETSAENERIQNHLSAHMSFTLTGLMRESDGIYRWGSGGPVLDYTPTWFGTANTNDNGMTIFSTFGWNGFDIDHDTATSYICELNG